MRRPALTFLCLLLTLVSTASAEEKPAWGSSRIQVEGADYELRCRRVDATLQHGWPGELFVYRVYRNGTFLHSEEREGAGRFAGCVYSHAEDAPVVAEPFPDAKDARGWMLLSGAICGNTHSRRVCLITVTDRESDHRVPDTYLESRFVSKFRPVTRRRGDEVEVWTSEQEWGGTGTAGSFMVPALRIVDRGGRVRRARLPSDVESWPDDADGQGWAGLLIAGLREESADLMRVGLDRVTWHGDGMSTFLEQHDLPQSREAMNELVEAVADVHDARARVDRLAGRYFPD